MQPQLFQSFIDAISSLTSSQKEILKSSLHNASINDITAADDELKTAPESACQTLACCDQLHDPSELCDLESMVQAQFAEHPLCPYCGGSEVQRWGIRKHRQRYHCKPCDSTFTAFTRTPLSGLRYPEKWGQYLASMPHSTTLREAASECEISLHTSFRWRHRFLEVLDKDQAPELSGTVELDETLFDESFKGQREDLPRPARKRGNDKNKARKVPVLVARDRGQHTVDGVLQNESAKELCRHLKGRISIEAIVCADAHLAHEKLAEILGFEFKELVTSKGQHVLEGSYHIQHVNAYHSHLKRWIDGVFHGVATKYLSHYLGWRRQLTEAIKLSAGRLVNKISAHWHHQPLTAT